MKKTKYIKEFKLDSAQYFVGDGNGGEVVLKVDYENKKFKTVNLNGELNKSLEREVGSVAKDLLKRKHGVNFANKLRILVTEKV